MNALHLERGLRGMKAVDGIGSGSGSGSGEGAENPNDDDDDEANDLDSTRSRLHGGAEDGKNGADGATNANLYEEDDEEVMADDGTIKRRHRFRRVRRWLRMVIFLACWLTFTLLLMINHEHEESRVLLCVPPNESLYYQVEEHNVGHEISVLLKGPFATPSLENHAEVNVVGVTVLRVYSDENDKPVKIIELNKPWYVHLVPAQHFDDVPQLLVQQLLRLNDVPDSQRADSMLTLKFKTDIAVPLPIQLEYRATPLPLIIGGTLALILLLGMVTMIIVHLSNYSVAAMFASTFSIAILAGWQLRPTLPELIKWLHIDLLLLLFSMTIIAAVFADSGMLDYIIYVAYRFTNGHIWPLLNTTIAIALIFSLVFGSVFTVLLLTPICIRYCEALELNPVPSLVILIIFTEFGSSFLPTDDSLRNSISDAQNPLMNSISFSMYAAHMLPGFIIVVVHSYIHIRLRFIDSSKMRFTDFHRLQRVIRVWKHTAKQISGYSKDEQVVRDTVMSKVHRMRQRMHRLGRMPEPVSIYEERLEQLRLAYRTHGPELLVMCFVVLVLLIVAFGTHVSPTLNALSRGWIALLATILLLILTDMNELESILARIDWSSMIFLAAMSILTDAMEYMGFFDWIIDWMRHIISYSNDSARLPVALFVIMWISAVSSSLLIDHAFLKIMLPLVVDMAESKELNLPLQPLFWAFLLGAAVGNAGTIIGAAANVVCAGVAEKHDYNMTFWYYFKISVPIMFLNMILLTIYLMVAHVAYHWH